MNREQEANAWLKENFQLQKIETLGEGKEAICVTDGNNVFKYFTDWQPQKGQNPTPDLLVARLFKQRIYKTIYPVRVEWRENNLPLFIYPFEKSLSYSGGMEDNFITFLREATESGFTMSNVHPDNFIVTRDGLRLVDYGVSFHPWTDEGFFHMARRTWLTLNCYNRGDLKILMRKALLDSTLPELTGFDGFLRKANRNISKWSSRRLNKPPDGFVKLGQEVTLDSRIISIAMAVQPKTVFDYGCGKGKIAEIIAKKGVKVTAWDPDSDKIARCKGYGSDVKYLSSYSEVLEIDEQFNVVICSIVACTLDAEKIPEVFSDLRRLISDNGRVVFSICNPFYTLETQSEIQDKIVPIDSHYRQHFTYISQPLTTLSTIYEFHRPWDWYKRKLNEAGLRIIAVEESEGVSPETGWPHPDFLMVVLEPIKKKRVSLIIRACALETDTIEIQVRHILRQLGNSAPLHQRIVAVDPRTHGFPRAHGKPNLDLLIDHLRKLKVERIIDEILLGPVEPIEVTKLNSRWFALDNDTAYAANGQAVATMISAIEHCHNNYIVAVDADIMFYNPLSIDLVEEAISVLLANPDAVTSSLNIVQESSKPWTNLSNNIPWRVEARAAVFRRDKLLSCRPLPNYTENNLLKLPWHRALDAKIHQDNLQSFRGGDSCTGFIHPQNELKCPRDRWLDVLERVEAGFVPKEQFGRVDLIGTGDKWSYPKRSEPYIFVICGRNVQSGRLKRCIDSLVVQQGPEWGAIVIDDDSDNGAAEYTEILTSTIIEKVTFIRNKIRKGSLANLYRGVHEFIQSPETVIITLDSDDSLIGTDILRRVASEYEKGADVTVGSMKVDKDVVYPVCFSDPRKKRGGNVWQHLRTFKKHLFDKIHEDDLKVDGKWIELASDWAYMIPIIEMSNKPVHIPDQLYLYEPSRDKNLKSNREQREIVIGKILAKLPYSVKRGREL